MPDNKTVIVATDGSDHSLRVLPHAQCLAENLGGHVELIRVVEEQDLREDRDSEDRDDSGRTRTRLEDQLNRDLQRYSVKGQSRVIVAGKDEAPADVLLNEASQAAILAMHSRGRGGIARLLGGSVAMGVIKQVQQPVMVGGPELLPPPPNGDTYRLLAATDLSPDADHALRAIAPLLEQGKFQVTLVYVHLHAPGGVDNDAERAKHEATLNEKRSLLPASVPVETHLREIPIGGGIDTAIMEEADKLDAQAILMATHGQSARHNLLMGSVALSVLGRCRLPVIVARAQPQS